MPPQQAKGVAAALAETAAVNLVTREYLDLRLSEVEARLRAELRTEIASVRTEIAAAKAGLMRWMVGTIGFQTVVILGAVAALMRLLH